MYDQLFDIKDRVIVLTGAVDDWQNLHKRSKSVEQS
jgi:hypothetical protein